MLALRYLYSKTFLAFSDQNRTFKKNRKAEQRPATRCWFILDYSVPYYHIGSWTIVFPSYFMINFRIVYISPIYQSLDKRIWFRILFQKNLQWLFLVPIGLIKAELPKCTPSILMEMWPYYLSCFINSFSIWPSV